MSWHQNCILANVVTLKCPFSWFKCPLLKSPSQSFSLLLFSVSMLKYIVKLSLINANFALRWHSWWEPALECLPRVLRSLFSDRKPGRIRVIICGVSAWAQSKHTVRCGEGEVLTQLNVCYNHSWRAQTQACTHTHSTRVLLLNSTAPRD